MTVAPSPWLFGPPLAAASLAFALAAFLLVRWRGAPPFRDLAAVLAAAGVAQLGNGLGFAGLRSERAWTLVALAGELALPPALFTAGLALAGPPAAADPAARWRARALALLAGLLTLLAWGASSAAWERRGWPSFDRAERVCAVYLVLALTLGLAQLEHLFRSADDQLRYRVKFVVIGLGALAGYEIFLASQVLLLPVRVAEYALAGSFAQLVALMLIAYGLGRRRLQRVTARVYVSQRVLCGSLTFLIVGLYLIAVGLVAEVAGRLGSTAGAVASALAVFLAAVALVTVLMSRAARAALRRFVARHFYRARYDYRAKWLEVTEAFRGCDTVDAILDRLIDLLGRTFGAPRISVWLRYEADGRYHQVRSVNTEPAPAALDGRHPLVARLAASDEPLAVEGAGAADDPFLHATGAALCAPIKTAEGLAAFVTLSREGDDPYGTEEADLARAIAHHAAVLLAHATLAEERRAAAEMEALHRFSAFCLHDLKNLAARLSLLVRNAEVHGQDPAFQRAAMRTVAATVPTMTALITKLSLGERREGGPDRVDVQAALAEAVGTLSEGGSAPVQMAVEPGLAVLVRRETLQRVLVNLLLNARQAVAQGGAIRIEARRSGAAVLIAVGDQGCGIPDDRLRRLFQPLETSRKDGLGIGLYHCKRLVEAEGGTIRVESTVGQGTRVEVLLPAGPGARGLATAGGGSAVGAEDHRAGSGGRGG